MGILSMNHRSPEFMAMMESTVKLLKDRLKIPRDYTVLFTGSATECWEVIAQSVIGPMPSLHFYNGAFGEKWSDYTRRLCPQAQAVSFGREDDLAVENYTKLSGLICVTQNETSNATQVGQSRLAILRKNNPASLIAVDATSSMAGIRLNFALADIWYASVQKCFGLPAGLAVMALSPKAMTRARSLKEKGHYNSLLFMGEMMEKWQTSFTPNVLGMYLLQRSLDAGKPITQTDRKTNERFRGWVKFFEGGQKLRLLVSNPQVRSKTVIAVQGSPATVEEVKSRARSSGFLLGEGYGALKKDSFRIANFPALKKKEIHRLMDFLRPHLQ
jgi:phosphoserine aminotransferase